MNLFNSFKKKKVETDLTKHIGEVLHTPVSNIMSKYVISIQKKELLNHAAQIIVGEKVSCVVVKDDDTPVGLVTERDFLKKVPLDKKKIDEAKVSQIMSPKLVTINPETTISEAIPILVKNNFRKLVVSKSGEMIGIVTQTDFVRLFNKFYHTLNVKTSDLLGVKDVMSKNVVSISKGRKFEEAKNKMSDKSIGSIVVMEGNRLSGIITEYDVVAELVEDPDKCKEKKVDDLMISPVMTINEDTDIFEANNIMVTDNVRRLPIMKDDELVGIVTQTDLCRSIFYFLKATIWHIHKKDIKWEKLEKRKVEKRLV